VAPCRKYPEVWKESLAHWVRAIRGRSEPRVGGADARPSIALIEACYANRKPLEFPWLMPFA
jgi:hypothetical protein